MTTNVYVQTLTKKMTEKVLKFWELMGKSSRSLTHVFSIIARFEKILIIKINVPFILAYLPKMKGTLISKMNSKT